MRHPDYPIWTFLGLIAVLLPATWHWRARNISTLSIIVWLALANLSLFINTIIWADNYEDSNPIWCDISSRLFSAITYAMPACSLSQMRKLESVASTRHTTISASARKRRIWEEVILCIVFPLVMLPVLYIVQGHRYRLTESIGPGAVPLFFSWQGLLIAYGIPLLVALASLVYAGLAVRWFLIRRLQFKSILAASDKHLNVDRYLRLIALAVGDSTVLVFNVAFLLGVVFADLSQFNFDEYTDWDTVHAGYSVISQYPEETLAPGVYYNFVVSFYTVPLYSFLFFTFFGLGEEAINDYVRALHAGRRLLDRSGIWPLRRAEWSASELPTLGSKVIPTTIGSHSLDATYRGSEPSTPHDRSFADSYEPTMARGRGAIGVTVEKTIV